MITIESIRIEFSKNTNRNVGRFEVETNETEKVQAAVEQR